jgi:hypothetical protein
MPRVTPVASKADVAPEHQAVVDDVLKVFGAVRGPFSMMLHSPEMTKRMLPLVPFFPRRKRRRGQAALRWRPRRRARA